MEKQTQKELETFTNMHVLACQTSLVETLLAKEIIPFSDIDNPYNKNGEPQEIYEWWIVDSWLLGKLKEHGEHILCTEYGSWWGRTCTGQAIFLDEVISEI